jgi:hypothetical protein
MAVLIVGQEVSIGSGVYGCKGKVVKITPDSVEVLVKAVKVDERYLRSIATESPEIQKELIADMDKPKLFRFDHEGKELDESRRDRLGFGPSPDDKFHTVLWHTAPECQPWEIKDVDKFKSGPKF